MRQAWFLSLIVMLAAPAVTAGNVHQIPIHHGTLRIHDLNSILCAEMHLPTCPAGGAVNLLDAGGAEFLLSVNTCLGSGSSLSISGDHAILISDPDRLANGRCNALRRMSRIYTAEKYPHATAAQARNWGLLLPAAMDPSKPLVVLIHGLDGDRGDCLPLGELLQHAGHQVAYFSYPGNQPIADSGALLGQDLRRLHHRYPQLRIDLIGHSMGGLVAREYVEGPEYVGGVERLIQVAPPNAGSSWARIRWVLGAQENYHLRRADPNWHWTWLITEGMGEAGDDLLPGSPFLRRLNSRPRRQGVLYTVVAGNKTRAQQLEAGCLQRVSCWIPRWARTWWGVRQCYGRLNWTATHVRDEMGDGDGPVSLCSTKLAGVSDFVVLPADHLSLYLPVEGHAPVAFAVVRDRLGR